jgi:DNA repair protein RecO
MKTASHARGLLVDRSRFQDTSLILTWITPDCGIIKTLARGALRPPTKSKPVEPLDLFYLCELTFLGSAQTELHTLKEWQVVNAFLPLRRSLLHLQTAHYFAKLTLALEETDQAIPEIYKVLEQALTYLETHEPGKKLLERYERKLASLTGFGDSIEAAFAHYHKKLPALRLEIQKALTR